MIANDVHDTTAVATLTFSLLSNYACDVHPRHITATVSAKKLKLWKGTQLRYYYVLLNQ